MSSYNIKIFLKTDIFFLLALDDSNDVRYAAQHLIFICGVDRVNFEISEETASL